MAARHRTAEIHAVALRHDAMNADLTAKPWMIPIENLLELGPVGVPKPCCTTKSAHMGRSDISLRSRCRTPVAQPARHRETGRKLSPPAIQRMVSDHHRETGRKLYPPAVQRMGSDQSTQGLSSKPEGAWGSDHQHHSGKPRRVTSAGR